MTTVAGSQAAELDASVPEQPETSFSDRRIALTSGGSVVAAAIHLWAAATHVQDGPAYVVFFATAAAAQLALAGLLAYRPRPLVAFAGALGTLALLSLYVASRVTALPLVNAEHHGAAVPTQLGIAVVAAELGALLALAGLVTNRSRAWTVNAAALCGVGLWALWLFAPGR